MNNRENYLWSRVYVSLRARSLAAGVARQAADQAVRDHRASTGTLKTKGEQWATTQETQVSEATTPSDSGKLVSLREGLQLTLRSLEKIPGRLSNHQEDTIRMALSGLRRAIDLTIEVTVRPAKPMFDASFASGIKSVERHPMLDKLVQQVLKAPREQQQQVVDALVERMKAADAASFGLASRERPRP